MRNQWIIKLNFVFFIKNVISISFPVSGVKWVPELLDQHTKEWQRLAKDVREEVSNIFTIKVQHW